MSTKKKQYSIWGLILYIVRLIFGNKKQKEEEQQQLNEELKQKYEGIDNEKEENKKQNVKDRINNMF